MMVSAFWLLVTKAWLNLVKASVSTNTFYLPSFGGSTFKKSIHNRDYCQKVTPAVYLDLCSDPFWHGTNANWWLTQLCLGTLYSSKISPLLEPMCSPIPDDHSHHVPSEALLVDILWGTLMGVTLQHWWCISDVTHPVTSPVNQTVADTFTLLCI